GMAFLYFKRPSCYICKYKAENKDFGLQADLIIGDFHGVSKKSREYNPWGVSQGSILTEKGKSLVSFIGKGYDLIEIPYRHIKDTNRGLFMPIPERGNRKKFISDYLHHSLHSACHSPMVQFTNKYVKIKDQLLRIRNVDKLPQKIFARIHSIFLK
nr:hypothetical protein [Bacteroidaceae bacterium]